jgi:Replicase family
MPFDGCLKQADLLDLPFRLFADIPAREFVAGQGKHNGHKRLSVGREDILDYAYIGINNDHCRRAAVADCDNDRWKRHFVDGRWIEQPAGCPVPVPPPNMIVENGDGSGRAHLIWLHRDAFLTPGAKIDMKSWTDQIGAGLAVALDADRDYRANKLVKNPLWSGCDPWGKLLGPAHRLTVLHDRIYDLHDFDSVKRLAPPNRKGADVDLATCTERTTWGRNCHLFELLRLATYPRYHPELTFDDYVCIIKYELLPSALTFVLAAHPVVTHPFTEGEIDRMIRQIAKFMVTKYRPPGRPYKECNRGVMGLAGTGLDIRVKRKMAADRTNGMRTDGTVELFQAYRRANPTAKAVEIAKAIGRSVRHVYRLLKQFVAPPVEKPVSPPVINTVKPSPVLCAMSTGC